MPPILYLIDGHALAYRMYFALTGGSGSRFENSKGEPTAGTYGFMNVLLRLLDEEKPEYLAVAFDTGKTFRNDMFPEYKATRSKMPDDLRPQIGRIKELIQAFNFPLLEKEGFEADDVLGSIANYAVSQGFAVKIYTGDRDLLQLVTDRIIVNLPGKRLSDSQDYTPEQVKDYLGVRPDQVVDYKALIGDSSDNIPGIRGVGEKTALKLFASYETLDEIYQNLENITGRPRKLLEEGKDSAYMSRDLAQIHCDIPINIQLEEAKTNNIDIDKLKQLFRDLEFKTIYEKLVKISGELSMPREQLSLFASEDDQRVGVPEQTDTEFVLVDSEEKLHSLAEELKEAEYISFDTETTSTDPFTAELVGISLAFKQGTGYYIPVGHKKGKNLNNESVVRIIDPFLSDPKKKLVGHNLKYDVIILQRHGYHPNNLVFDTMIAEWIINPSARRFGLKDLADSHLGIEMTRIENLIGSGKKQISMAEVAIDRAAPYACADADIPLRLMENQSNRLKDQPVEKTFEEIEMPLIPVLAKMEQAGISLDTEFLKDMSVDLEQRENEIKEEVFQTVGYEFNLNSTQQLSKALFETLKLDPPDPRKKTASGFYSTSAAVLEQLTGKHQVVDSLLVYREITKLRSTYVDALPLQVNPLTGRIHTSFSQTGSVTGRLASSNPNLQNIPTRTDLGRKVRRAFVAAPGNVLLAVDYSQIELRIVAHMSEDKSMLDAFHNNQDIHATTAAAIYDIPLDEVTKDQRRHAKAINFGLIYGMSAFGLSNTTELTLAESEDFVKAYFTKFPGVKRYLDGIRKSTTETGYVETLLGRRRYFPNLMNTRNQNIRRREEREAINAPIQGTAADIMKIAMINLDHTMTRQKSNAKILLQVHDELILECSKPDLETTASLVQETMQNAYALSIPLLTDARYGENWEEMQAL